MQKCKKHKKYSKHDCQLCSEALKALIRKMLP